MTEITINRREEKELFFKALVGSPFFTIFASVLTTFIVGAIFFKVGGGVPINVNQTSTEKISTFDVTGEGKSIVVPDQASITLGVSEQGYNLKTLQNNINTKMDKLAKSLKDLGVDDKDIKTTSYNYYPDYQNKGQYQAHATVSVTIRDLDNTSAALDLVGQLGLDNVSGPRFELSDELLSKAKHDAREMAIQKAKNNAEELADLAGMKLGRIVNVSEGVNNSYPVPMMERADALKSSEVVSTPVEVGSSEVSLSVTLSYETR